MRCYDCDNQFAGKIQVPCDIDFYFSIDDGVSKGTAQLSVWYLLCPNIGCVVTSSS